MATGIPRLRLAVAAGAFAAATAATAIAAPSRLDESSWPWYLLRGDGVQEVKSHLCIGVAGGVFDVSVNSNIDVSVSDLNIPRIGLPIFLAAAR
jgi:hypothetical protein